MLSHVVVAIAFCGVCLASPTNSSDLYRTWNRAAYFQDNDPVGNFIVALKIDPQDGTLSTPVRTSTGGKGLAGLVAISQDSVVVADDYLFTTNAGDNTLSMFVIDPTDPLHPRLVGKPESTLGQTPVSVAYSSHLGVVCVTNGGSLAGVACFSVSRYHGLTSLGPIHTIPQTQNADPSPPPAGPQVLTADIVFNPSSTALFVTVRSNGKNPGLLYAFAVDRYTGAISRSPVVTSLSDFVFLFSMNFLSSDTRMIITDPHLNSPGAGVLEIKYPSLKASVEKIITIPNQKASCWVAYSPQYSPFLYVIDAAQPNVTIVDPRNDEVSGVFDIPSGTPGNGGFDTKIDRKWLYVITDRAVAPKVEVFKIGKQGTFLRSVQSFDIFSSVGQIPDWMGLAIWPSTY
ncbi:MAG: hypothetical protein Q9220_003772 [cf. Caloplaca sp. 1 TL-2023]